jgi:hypothetical protein
VNDFLLKSILGSSGWLEGVQKKLTGFLSKINLKASKENLCDYQVKKPSVIIKSNRIDHWIAKMKLIRWEKTKYRHDKIMIKDHLEIEGATEHQNQSWRSPRRSKNVTTSEVKETLKFWSSFQITHTYEPNQDWWKSVSKVLQDLFCWNLSFLSSF